MRAERTASGVSLPIDPTASSALRASGASMTVMSSCAYPNRSCRRRSGSVGAGGGMRGAGRSDRCRTFSSYQRAYGRCPAMRAFSSSSGTIRPSARSTRKSFPGCRRPLRTIVSGGSGSTPVSEASTTQPSAVSYQRPGRSPLRSSVAPMTRPSVNAIAAGPSHASVRQPWYA